MKKVITLILCLLITIFVTGCSNKSKEDTVINHKKPKVVASIYAIKEFTLAVAEDKVEVELLIPPGVEAHDWSPAAKDIQKIQDADLFIYNGGGMEPWVEKVSDALSDKKPVFLEAGKDIFVDAYLDKTNPNNNIDPHIWLDPILAIKMVTSIKESLVLLDNQNAKQYTSNAEKYIEKLEKIGEEYTLLANETKNKEFVTMHSAFSFLASRYGWQELSLVGATPHAEPTPSDLAKLIKKIKDKNLKYIFIEPNFNEKIMQEIATQTNTTILILDPMENPIEENGLDYLQRSMLNLKNLKKAFSDNL